MKVFARCGKSLLKASHLKFWYVGKCISVLFQVLRDSNAAT